MERQIDRDGSAADGFATDRGPHSDLSIPAATNDTISLPAEDASAAHAATNTNGVTAGTSFPTGGLPFPDSALPSPASDTPGVLVCPRCGAGNTPGARRCSTCGYHFVLRCRACGELNLPDATVCAFCGESLRLAAFDTREIARARAVVRTRRGLGKGQSSARMRLRSDRRESLSPLFVVMLITGAIALALAVLILVLLLAAHPGALDGPRHLLPFGARISCAARTVGWRV